MRARGNPTAAELALVAVMLSDEFPEDFASALDGARTWLAEVRELRDALRAMGPDVSREDWANRKWEIERAQFQRLTAWLDAVPGGDAVIAPDDRAAERAQGAR